MAHLRTTSWLKKLRSTSQWLEVSSSRYPKGLIPSKKFNRAASNLLFRNIKGSKKDVPVAIAASVYSRNASIKSFSRKFFCTTSVGDNDGSSVGRFNFIADAADIAAPGVVYIEVEINSGLSTGKGAGSGFIVFDYGIILTNAHVINRASSVNVRLASGEVYPGAVIGLDNVADLAVIQIHPSGKLPTVALGSSASLRAGEWVVALGSPLNLSNTVTAGIVSAVHRDSKDLGLRKGTMKYIQTDAAINQGNSGGPLVNLNGEVIGINAMTLLNTSGISFAIPIDRARSFLLQSLEIRDKKSDSHSATDATTPYIGVKMMTLTPQLSNQLHQQLRDFPVVDYGVLVVDVVRNSPAFQGGLRAHDIITEVDGSMTSSSEQFHDLVTRGREINITVARPGAGIQRLRVKPTVVSK